MTQEKSLGLLPSRPDPVGEQLTHHQPPSIHIDNISRKSKRNVLFLFTKKSHAYCEFSFEINIPVILVI